MDGSRITLATVVLDCPDANSLADFYATLLGWEISLRESDWVLMRSPAGGTGLAFQSEAWYQPPVWPEQAGHQTKMLHLDLRVHDLEAAVGQAVSAGATLVEYQPQDDVRVLLDPAGHPFCLFLD